MQQVTGYFASYSDARAIMGKLQIPGKGADDIILQHPINDWLARTKHYNVVCTTVGHMYSDCKDAEGVFLITNVKTVRRSKSQNGGTLVERDKDKYVKTWLAEESGVKGNSLQWMSFPDGDELGLLNDGIRPRRNGRCGPFFDYRLTFDQVIRMVQAGMTRNEWAAQAISNGEVVERIWPPQEGSSHP